MVRFPETVEREWRNAAFAVESKIALRRQIDRDTQVENAVQRLWVNHTAKLRFQQELDAQTTPPLEMFTLAEYSANPAKAPADMIDGVMKEDGLCVVVGPSRVGKTTIALQMLHSLLTGSTWFGQSVTQIDGAVGLMSYDMDAGMLMNWMGGAPGIDPTKVIAVNTYKQGNPLGVASMRQQIAEVWKTMNVEVVVVDSFSASFFGLDQNDAAATMAHYRDLKLFALSEVGAKALVVITHSTESNPSSPRGSTVHVDTADTMVSVKAEENGARRITVEKYRAALGQAKMSPVIIGAPDPVTHLCGVDGGSMALAGLPLPAEYAFDDVPEPENEPEIEETDMDVMFESEEDL